MRVINNSRRLDENESTFKKSTKVFVKEEISLPSIDKKPYGMAREGLHENQPAADSR
jgi:hypothetical protein